ncbi:ABC-2 family transporter protein [Patescibacteria group bacterium]|nr:ABC-2 family transporter protein [Patescibacteria group bacterium]
MIFFKKYIQIAKTSWANGFVYRLNFVMWRIRNVIQLLTIYFLWFAVSSNQDKIFSYTQASILTYVLGSSIIRAMVLSSRSIDAQGEIASGDLSNHLVKPINYFIYWASRDMSDKLLNILFAIFEITLLIVVIRPPIQFQTNLALIALFAGSVVLAAILFFIFSFIISMTTFWYYEYNGWAQRYLSFVILEALAGGLFPLDILPPTFAKIAIVLPTAYFIYFPMQIYLGRINPTQIVVGYAVMLFWIVALYYFGQMLWKKGLKVYGAYGR